MYEDKAEMLSAVPVLKGSDGVHSPPTHFSIAKLYIQGDRLCILPVNGGIFIISTNSPELIADICPFPD